MKGYRHSSRVWGALAFSSILLVGTAAWAQGPSRSTPVTPQAVTKDGGEASGADGTAELKNSPSVKSLARMLRVSTATGYQIFVALNFATMVAVIVWFLGPRLPVWLRIRAQAIRQSLDDAAKASIDAQQRLSAIEARMLKLQSEISAMQAAADQEEKAEETRLRASAEEETRKIAAIAEQEILASVARAKRDFKIYAAELMVTLAGSRIKVDTSTDEEILHSFIYQLGGKGSN